MALERQHGYLVRPAAKVSDAVKAQVTDLLSKVDWNEVEFTTDGISGKVKIVFSDPNPTVTDLVTRL